MKDRSVAIFWFRRDLRLNDNHGLYEALRSGVPVLPIFIFDRHILDRLEDRDDRRISFIHDRLKQLQDELHEKGSTLLIEAGEPLAVLNGVIDRWPVKAVFTNHDHEPCARERDARIAELLGRRGIPFRTFKDQTIFERDEVLKDDGGPYTVFTPYMRKWRTRLAAEGLPSYPSQTLFNHLLPTAPTRLPDLSDMGFYRASYHVAPLRPEPDRLRAYAKNRDLPGAEYGCTGVGVHLRFGTVSVRDLVRMALKYSEPWLNELIWREFFMQILWHFPHVESSAFRPAYDRIPWRNNEDEFRAWCTGSTGYPLVDAGMRQLRAKGMMHNRVRMVTASFLTKHLLIDWRWGEAWFARWLMDFELSSNNGNWQWAAGSGCDAAPYFRVFNPQLQLKRFDPRMDYVLRWAPEYGGLIHPMPIVEHAVARARALQVYGTALDRA